MLPYVAFTMIFMGYIRICFSQQLLISSDSTEFRKRVLTTACLFLMIKQFPISIRPAWQGRRLCARPARLFEADYRFLRKSACGVRNECHHANVTAAKSPMAPLLIFFRNCFPQVRAGLGHNCRPGCAGFLIRQQIVCHKLHAIAL